MNANVCVYTTTHTRTNHTALLPLKRAIVIFFQIVLKKELSQTRHLVAHTHIIS